MAMGRGGIVRPVAGRPRVCSWPGSCPSPAPRANVREASSGLRCSTRNSVSGSCGTPGGIHRRSARSTAPWVRGQHRLDVQSRVGVGPSPHARGWPQLQTLVSESAELLLLARDLLVAGGFHPQPARGRPPVAGAPGRPVHARTREEPPVVRRRGRRHGCRARPVPVIVPGLAIRERGQPRPACRSVCPHRAMLRVAHPRASCRAAWPPPNCGRCRPGSATRPDAVPAR